MRIVWSVPVLADGIGSGRGDLVRAAGLIDALRTAGHEVDVVEAAAAAGSGRRLYRNVVRRLLPGRLPLVLRDLVRGWKARGHGRRVAEVARSRGAEILVETHVHGVPSGSLAARSAGLPLVLDDVSPPTEERALGSGLPSLVRRAFRRETEAARAVVVSSRSLRRRLTASGLPAAKVSVVPSGVDLEAYRSADREEARRRLGLGGQLVIGFVGSFQPWHRVELLVEAIAPVAERLSLHLLLAGEGKGLEEALSAARRLGVSSRVTATGAVSPSRVPRILAACDLGALPGTNEYGQPMKLLEYAAARLAIVAPDVAPVRETIEDGVTGLLFAPGDPVALRAAVGRLAGTPDLRSALGNRAWDRLARPASWDDRASSLAAVLRAAGGRSPEEGDG